MRLSPDVLLGYFPLYGATFDSIEVGWVGGRVSAYVPEVEEWRLVEQSDVARERALTHLPRRSSKRPYDPAGISGAPAPLCLVVGEDIPNDERAFDAIGAAIGPMMSDAADAILALRLLRPGWFLDPEHSMRTFRYAPSFFNQRVAGPYRQAGLSGAVEGAFAAYELRLDDLITAPDDEPPIAQLFGLVQAYREQGTGAADIAIRNFGHSYGYTLTGTARALMLFTALDAMLGGMSVRQIGLYKVTTTFAERLQQALELGPESPRRWAESESAWLDSEGRRLRNALVHGRPSEVADFADGSHERIRAVVRHVLTLYIEFCVQLSLEMPLAKGEEAQSPVAEFIAAVESS